jgi:phage terminase large subunit-like protein
LHAASIERLEDRVLKKTITIDNSPVTYMCAANAALIEDGMKNRAFDKKRSRGRIDGIVTIAMGAGAADAKPPAQAEVILGNGGRMTIVNVTCDRARLAGAGAIDRPGPG